MPNGKGFPQCTECSNFELSQMKCKIHNFLYPCISYEALCRNYFPGHEHGQKTNNKIRNLKKNYLYYYSYAYKPQYKILGKFSELQTPIFSINIIEDMKHGWFIGVSEWQKELSSKSFIFIVDNDRRERFDIATLKRDIAPSMKLEDINHILSFVPDKKEKDIMTKGLAPTTKVRSETIIGFIHASMASRVINSFLSKYVNLKDYQKAKGKIPFLEIGAFLRNIKDQDYELRQDEHNKLLISEAKSNRVKP